MLVLTGNKYKQQLKGENYGIKTMGRNKAKN
jgi:hypothetical protein